MRVGREERHNVNVISFKYNYLCILVINMRTEIIEKLNQELDTDVKSEANIVYILSRIRKILELEKKQADFRVLNFYCNWALHAEIERIVPVKSLLDQIVQNDTVARENLSVNFLSLHEELIQFIEEFDLSTKIYASEENTSQFNKLLSQIYSDTPLLVRDQNLKVSWTGKDSPRDAYLIEPL